MEYLPEARAIDLGQPQALTRGTNGGTTDGKQLDDMWETNVWGILVTISKPSHPTHGIAKPFPPFVSDDECLEGVFKHKVTMLRQDDHAKQSDP